MDILVNKADLDVDGFRLRIKQARIAREFSQSALAELIGVTAACICKWENGGNFPKSARLAKLANVLGTSVSYLGSGVNLPPDYQSAVSGVRREHLRHVTRLARSMIAEAASVPLESVTIQIDQPNKAGTSLRGH